LFVNHEKKSEVHCITLNCCLSVWILRITFPWH
jgi:hypothetical protein